MVCKIEIDIEGGKIITDPNQCFFSEGTKFPESQGQNLGICDSSKVIVSKLQFIVSAVIPIQTDQGDTFQLGVRIEYRHKKSTAQSALIAIKNVETNAALLDWAGLFPAEGTIIMQPISFGSATITLENSVAKVSVKKFNRAGKELRLAVYVTPNKN